MDSPSTTTTIKKPCFIGEDNGLASIAHFSTILPNPNHNHHNLSNNNNNNNNINNVYNNNNNGYFVDYENHMMRRRNSLRNISSLSNHNSTSNSVSSSPTTTIRTPVFSGRSRFDEFYSPHFLESCALCHKPLGGNRDIFMYRGDTPFCSEECRQEQIEMDEANEKNWKLKALRSKKEAQKSTSKSHNNNNYSFRTSTVAAA